MEKQEIDEKSVSAVEADVEWLAKNYQKFAREFEGKFVAIKNRKILTASKTMDELLQWLEKNNFDPRSVLVESIAPRSFACIL